VDIVAARAVHGRSGGGDRLLLNRAGAARAGSGRRRGGLLADASLLQLYQGLNGLLLSNSEFGEAGSDGHLYTLYMT
jgi:hypothetical protein